MSLKCSRDSWTWCPSGGHLDVKDAMWGFKKYVITPPDNYNKMEWCLSIQTIEGREAGLNDLRCCEPVAFLCQVKSQIILFIERISLLNVKKQSRNNRKNCTLCKSWYFSLTCKESQNFSRVICRSLEECSIFFYFPVVNISYCVQNIYFFLSCVTFLIFLLTVFVSVHVVISWQFDF